MSFFIICSALFNGITPLTVYIIPQKWEFVNRFLQNFSNFFNIFLQQKSPRAYAPGFFFLFADSIGYGLSDLIGSKVKIEFSILIIIKEE